MKALVTAAALLLAGTAHAQTPPAEAAPAPPAGNLTRDLNSGPPAPAIYLAPAPAPVASPSATASVTPSPRPAPATAPPARSVVPTPVLPTPVLPPTGSATPPPDAIPSRLVPIPAAPAPRPRMVPIAPPGGTAAPTLVRPPSESFTPPGKATTPVPSVALEADVAPAPAPPPALTVLDSAARAALPFTAELPPGFEIVTGRPGPDFRIYTIRRGAQSFVMVYAGPASQFPIYTGQMVEAAGRASILSTEDGVRHAVEHLFQRTATPREIHVWTMSLDGADRDTAEQIAQSVDVR